MKTIVIYDQLEADVQFIVLNGDYSHLNGVYINSIKEGATKKEQKAHEKLQDELTNLIYEEDGGDLKVTLLEEFPIEYIHNDPDTIVIKAGFLP